MTFDPHGAPKNDIAAEISDSRKPKPSRLSSTPAIGKSLNQSSRRGFLSTTAKTTAIASAVSFFNRSVHAAGSDIIKVGLVGCGGRGMGAAKDNMTADAGCRLTAIAEVFYNRLDWFSDLPVAGIEVVLEGFGSGESLFSAALSFLGAPCGSKVISEDLYGKRL